MTIGDMAEQERDMEIEKDQEASGMKDVAEGAAAQEPEKEPEKSEAKRS